MADVFISYHRSDGASALVRRIAEELESRGVSCWYDTKNTAPVDFVERIVTEIECCKVFLFIWDEKANEDSKQANSYVRSEIQCAYGEKRIALFPFQVGNFEKNKTLRFYFGHINIPYVGDTPETAQIGELVNAIADTVGKTQPQPIVTQPTTLPKIIKSGKCYKNLTYTLDKNGVLTISGYGPLQNGAMRGSSFSIWRHLGVNEEISHVEIQYGVTAIRGWVFAYCTKLTSVNIPNSVTYIGSRAFLHCMCLKSVIIPNGVTSIESAAFLGCAELTSVNIPDSVTYIGDGTFRNCPKLTHVSVPTDVEIHPEAFSHSTNVTRREAADNQ